ncbi:MULTISPECIES: hypothetical protein [Romboutsia]|uniref:hypothetical protein n=1 Tax=Romboutsia TaxID=1501226 RepID=UPI00189B3029|nr:MULTISPECIES: hypothetical protein [Romboutsia]MCH1960771.1 hypothetical protein [Romboutsia hominis]MCH1968795.1 hypothetical protein [Romboutsia hominis]MDB8789901.1 hypothetical protein [Romboutsia sp. 1001216sp1]MDB8801695.1 hypothetical protein [Romboutsia sp. 1001216sp1]MDB8804326.1 hypothetical protein [Romboutsia sp. 1001216sp1]
MDKDNQLLKGILIGSATLAALSVISPSIRKITTSTVKATCKQQMKLLAGIGVLSIANYISNLDDDIYTIDDI